MVVGGKLETDDTEVMVIVMPRSPEDREKVKDYPSEEVLFSLKSPVHDVETN